MMALISGTFVPQEMAISHLSFLATALVAAVNFTAATN